VTKAGKGNKSHDVLYYIDEFFHCSCAISCRTLVPCKHVCILAIFKEEINFGEIFAADADSRTHCRLDSRVIPGHTFHNIFSMPNTALLSPPKDTATERSSFMQRANNSSISSPLPFPVAQNKFWIRSPTRYPLRHTCILVKKLLISTKVIK